MTIEGIMTVALIFPGYFFFREKPPTPPSFLASRPPIESERSMLFSLRQLVRSRDYVLIFFIYSIYIGSFKVFTITLSDYLKLFGVCNSEEISILLICPIPLGFFGSWLIVYLIRKKPLYRIYTQAIIGLTILQQVLFYLALMSQEIWLVRCTMVLIGISVIPASVAMTEWAQEVAFPTLESYIFGIMVSGGQVFGASIGVAAEYIIEIGAKRLVCQKGVIISSQYALYESIFLISLLSVCLIICFFIREDLKRTNQELSDKKILQKVSQIVGENK